jgi:RNA pseudouridylate synthase
MSSAIKGKRGQGKNTKANEELKKDDNETINEEKVDILNQIISGSTEEDDGGKGDNGPRQQQLDITTGTGVVIEEKEEDKDADKNTGSTTFNDKDWLNTDGCGVYIDPSSKKIIVRIPIGVVSYREGIHECSSKGKKAMSGFKSLGYCEHTDTSLIECELYTGRTHQLRLHLQLLGNLLLLG